MREDYFIPEWSEPSCTNDFYDKPDESDKYSIDTQGGIYRNDKLLGTVTEAWVDYKGIGKFTDGVFCTLNMSELQNIFETIERNAKIEVLEELLDRIDNQKEEWRNINEFVRNVAYTWFNFFRGKIKAMIYELKNLT